MKVNSTYLKVLNRIANAPSGSVFVISDFTDLANYEAVKKVLARLADQCMLRRVLRGVYDKPRLSSLLHGDAAPDLDQVAHAIARNYNWSIAANGETALNQIGLTSKTPTEWSYISSGPYKQYAIGDNTLTFAHRSDSQMIDMSEKTLLLVQALKAIGSGRLSSTHIKQIRSHFSSDELQIILSESQHTIKWVYEEIKDICK